MEQQKMKRLLRLLMLLAGRRWCPMTELMERMECTDRTIYRYLDTFETAGFVIERNQGTYRLQKDHTNTRTLQNLMHFSEEEVWILYETLALIEGTSPVKERLIRKLNALYDNKALAELQRQDELGKIQLLSEAIRKKKQVVLQRYRSSHSDKIADRRVEPFDYLPDYRSVWCYDYDTDSCRQFKLARMEGVAESPRSWEKEPLHRVYFTDAFRMSASEPVETVVARLSLKAYNLLLEEFPLSRDHVQEAQGAYRLSIPIAGYPGIGRFVLGLPGEIEVLAPERFKEFLRAEQKKIAH